MIWKSCSTDEALLIDLYKVLAEISATSTPELLFFIHKIVL